MHEAQMVYSERSKKPILFQFIGLDMTIKNGGAAIRWLTQRAA